MGKKEEIKKRILLLEDEEVLGALYKKHMETHGYEVLWLLTTKGLEEQALDFQPDLILLDHAIRGEERSGMEMALLLREARLETPIFILSNYDRFQLEEMGEGLNNVKFLLKIDNSPVTLVKKILHFFSN